MNCVAVDLFCGIGGLTYGIRKAGITVAAGIDIDSTCQYAYEENNDSVFINKGVEDIKKEEIESYYPKGCIKVLMGCAPCQPFSTYSLRYTKEGPKDEKWKLLYYFRDLVKEIKPDIISMENVPQLVKKEVFGDFVNGLEAQGYHVSWQIVNCADYGVPQSRSRLVLLASKFGDISPFYLFLVISIRISSSKNGFSPGSSCNKAIARSENSFTSRRAFSTPSSVT